MAKLDRTQTGSVKGNFKCKRKYSTSVTGGSNSLMKRGLGNAMTLDDVFESVVNGTCNTNTVNITTVNATNKKTSASITNKKSIRAANNLSTIILKKADKPLTTKKIVRSGRNMKCVSSPHLNKRMVKSQQSAGAQKFSSSGDKVDSLKKPKLTKNRKSESAIVRLNKTAVTVSQSPKRKVLKTKCWRTVDDEISFLSEDEKGSALKSKPHLITHTMSGNMKLKYVNNINALDTAKVTSALLSKDKTKTYVSTDSVLTNQRLESGSIRKSAFRPMKRKNNRLKVQPGPVSCLVGNKTKSKSDNKADAGTGKVKSNSRKLTKRKLHTSEISIETELECDDEDEVLYFLSDNSDPTINMLNSTESSQDKAVDNMDAGRSKSDSSVDICSDKSKSYKGKKLAGVKKSTTGKSMCKKIKLLDSLKKTSPGKTVRPVSPTPVYTTVNHSSPIGTDLPSSQPLNAQSQWVLDDGITPSTAQSASLPISPASMSYKVLLENLPRELHPKNKKKTDIKVEDEIERRVSVRASECAFRYKEIVIKKCQKYTQIWLNTHTKMKNALNPVVMNEISSALNSAKYDDSNLVMFSGLGNVFCSGIDLHYLTIGDRKIAAMRMANALRDLVRKFITFPKLIVAIVTGPAIGLGSALLPLCDIVYASDKATFYMPYAQLSQTPEGCASFTLPNIVGIAMANELLVGGRKITAIEACQLGFVSQVYWPTSMMQEVIPRVQHMALVSGKVLETTKLLMRSHQRTKLDLTNESECSLLVERWYTNECQRAIEEFLSNEKNYML